MISKVWINLNKSNLKTINKFCEDYGLDFLDLKEDKKNGISRIWVVREPKLVKIVAFTTIYNGGVDIKYIDKTYENKISNFPKYDINLGLVYDYKIDHPVEKKEKKLTVNDILDKINEKGMDSLSKEDLNILKNF